MTSRRGLMKLLAALPFAAPVVAKEVAAQVSGASPFGMVCDEVFWTTGGNTMHWEPITLSYDAERFRIALDAAPTQPNEALRALLCGPARSDTPNRLYGVRINSDGDAV